RHSRPIATTGSRRKPEAPARERVLGGCERFAQKLAQKRPRPVPAWATAPCFPDVDGATASRACASAFLYRPPCWGSATTVGSGGELLDDGCDQTHKPVSRRCSTHHATRQALYNPLADSCNWLHSLSGGVVAQQVVEELQQRGLRLVPGR